jgi:TRAP-type C4-dicarboxylate transport system permease small subunit
MTMNPVLVALFLPVFRDIRRVFRFLSTRVILVAYIVICTGVYVYWAGTYGMYIETVTEDLVPPHSNLWIMLSCIHVCVCGFCWPYVKKYPSRVREELK